MKDNRGKGLSIYYLHQVEGGGRSKLTWEWEGWVKGIIRFRLGKFHLKKKTFWWIKSNLPQTPPPPPPPPNVDYVFFNHCFIILFQYLDIFFYIKSIKNMWKVDSDRNPPPIVDLIHQNVFLFIKLPLQLLFRAWTRPPFLQVPLPRLSYMHLPSPNQYVLGLVYMNLVGPSYLDWDH